jgi:hypothetical protein
MTEVVLLFAEITTEQGFEGLGSMSAWPRP